MDNYRYHYASMCALLLSVAVVAWMLRIYLIEMRLVQKSLVDTCFLKAMQGRIKKIFSFLGSASYGAPSYLGVFLLLIALFL